MIVFGAVVGANLLIEQTEAAEPPAETPSAFVEDLVRELDGLKKEVRYLRERDADRQTRPGAVVNPLTQSRFRSISTGTSSAKVDGPSEPDLGAPMTGCGSVGCTSSTCQSCNQCGSQCILGCQCPQKEAPCIDCPRVSTASPFFNVNVFGALKLDMLFNRARPISPGVPFFLAPQSLRGLDTHTVDIHARQTTLGAVFTGPKIGDLQAGGLVTAMFFNSNVLADQYGFLPLQGYGELKNEDWRFAAGLQFDVFSPGLPTVLPFSALAGSGNAGNSFRGQIRLEHFSYPSENVQITCQLALSEPVVTTIDPTFRLSEDNGWPNVEGRIALGVGALEGAGLAAKRPYELGVSGVVGQVRTTPPLPDDRVVADVWGLGADLRWKMTDRCGVMGEIYTGRTLGTYNGGILQNLNLDTLEGLRTTGGWVEFFLHWNPCLHSHVGYGIDDPDDTDVANSFNALGRLRNETYFANLLWDVTPSFRAGFEFTWRDTDYKVLPDNQGPGFHTQFQWSF